MIEKGIIQSQYYAGLEMLRLAIEACPKSAWNHEHDHNKFWHISYHTLFYTHLYLQAKEEEFKPWEKHRKECHFLGPLPWPPHRAPEVGVPYTKGKILDYFDFCLKEVGKKVGALDLSAASGFHWLPFNKLELQFYNIRHIQHHAGQLIDRLRNREDIGVDWVGWKEI